MDPFALGLAVVLGLLLVKEAGLPVPVPGDLLVLGLGIGAAEGRFDPVLALGGAIGVSVVGGAVQYALVRGVARGTLLRLLARFGVSRERVEALGERLRRRGATGVALARMTPGVRIGAIAAAGLVAVPFGSFLAGVAAGNGVFIAAHFALGVGFGAAAGQVAATFGPALLGLVALAVVGWFGWRVLAARRARAGAAPAGDWSDACCPACLAVAAVSLRQG